MGSNSRVDLPALSVLPFLYSLFLLFPLFIPFALSLSLSHMCWRSSSNILLYVHNDGMLVLSSLNPSTILIQPSTLLHLPSYTFMGYPPREKISKKN